MQASDAGLKDFLLGVGQVPRRALEELEHTALERQEPLSELLVAGGYLSRDELRRAHAHLLGVPFITLSSDTIEQEALFLIPEPLARGRNLVAFRQQGAEVEVALLDLSDLEALDFLLAQNIKVLPRLTTAESIKRALLIYQKKLKEQFGALARGGAHATEALLRHALLSRASSVHLDLKTLGLLVRYRIQGLLHEAMTLPKESAEVFARLKEMAKLSPTLHVPQEGAFKLELGGGETVRVRAYAHPAHAGERLVLHLLPETVMRKGFTPESLGLHGESLEGVHTLLNAKSGLIVVAGPAMSGKTTLLYTLLDVLDAHHRSLVTVEEEIELALPHATQLRVRPEVGLTSAATLRAALKQDPDVVMVGSVGDAETAELVVSAAARGLLVLAGVEAQNVEEALGRLISLGAQRAALEANLKGAMAVRVVGRVCPVCHEKYRLSRAEGQPFEGLANFGRVLAHLKEEEVTDKDIQWKDIAFARASSGCGECAGGYNGFIGLQEVLIKGEAPLNLVEDGLFKAAQGVTSIEEVRNAFI